MSAGIVRHFASLEDPRIDRNKLHALMDIVVLTFGIPADAPRFVHPVRGHWGSENRLHWRLDVVFGEGASRIRKGHAP